MPNVEVTSSGEVVGVDLGINRPAVASSRAFLGKRQWEAVDRRYYRLKKALQSKGQSRPAAT